MTDARVTQVGLDAVVDTDPDARVTQVGLDAVVDTDPDARVTQVGMEVVWAPRLIPTPPRSYVAGVNYVDLVKHTGGLVTAGGITVTAGGVDVKVADYWT